MRWTGHTATTSFVLLSTLLLAVYGYVVATGGKQFVLPPQAVTYICSPAKKPYACHFKQSILTPALAEALCPAPDAQRFAPCAPVVAEKNPLLQFTRQISQIYHPHLLRFLVVSPAIMLGAWLDMAPSAMFNGLCMVLVAASILTSTAIVSRLHIARHAATILPHGACILAMTVAWIGMSYFMNGRLLIAFFGFLLIMLGQIRQLEQARMFHPSALLLQGAGLFLCTVSGGTLMVAVTALLGFLGLCGLTLKKQAGNRRMVLLTLAGMAVMLGVIALNAIEMLQKNLHFFRFDLGRMLSHGPLQSLDDVGIPKTYVLLLLICYWLCIAISALTALRWSARHLPAMQPLILMMASNLGVGIMGDSSMAGMVPPMLIITVFFLQKAWQSARSAHPI